MASNASKGKKRIKRAAQDTDALGEDEVAVSSEVDGTAAVPINRLLFLKPVFSKKPWYVGGKCVFSRDGATVYCPTQGGVAIVKNFNEIVTVLAKSDDIVSFAVSAGPETIATCSRRGLVRVFGQGFKEERSFNSMHNGPISEMDFDPTGECIATGSTDQTVRVFSASGGYVTHNFKGHRGIISAVKFHPNEGNLSLITADVTGVVSLWDLRTKKNVWFRNHISCVPSVAFLHSNNIVTVGRDRVISVWSKDSPDVPLKTIPTFESMETVVALDSSANHFVTGGANGVVKKWKFDIKTNECTMIESIDETGGKDAISQLSLIKPSPSSSSLRKESSAVVVSITQTECIFSFRDAKALEKQVQGRMIGFDDEIFDLAFLGSKNRIAVATNSPFVRIYSFSPDQGLPERAELLVGHDDAVLSVAAHPDFLVTGSKDQSARLWDPQSLTCLGKCDGHTDSVSAVSVCSKSIYKYFATGSDDCTIRMWSYFSSNPAKTPPQISCCDQRVAHSKPVLDVCFSPNDEILASASADRTCKLWQLDHSSNSKCKISAQPLQELKGHRRAVNSVRFSTIDKVVCTSSADMTVRIWSISTGACVRTLQGHTSPVTCALFALNGTSLVTSAADGTIKTWDLKTSICGQTLFGQAEAGHNDRIWSLALYNQEAVNTPGDDGEALQQPQQQFIGSVGIDGVIALWRDATSEERERRLQEKRSDLLNKEELDRSIREKRYLDAARLALQFDRPHQLRQIFESIEPVEIPTFAKTLLTESSDGKRAASFLAAVVSWNTLGRTSVIAQRCISACVLLGPKLETLVGPTTFQKFVTATRPYTERHFARMDRLLKSSYILDRVLETSSIV